MLELPSLTRSWQAGIRLRRFSQNRVDLNQPARLDRGPLCKIGRRCDTPSSSKTPIKGEDHTASRRSGKRAPAPRWGRAGVWVITARTKSERVRLMVHPLPTLPHRWGRACIATIVSVWVNEVLG